MQRKRQVDIHRGYVLRVQGALVATLLLLIAAARWWPVRGDGLQDHLDFDTRGEQVVMMEMIQPTRQARRAPPPPAPLPPIEVPDDVVLAEEVIDLDSEISFDAPASGDGGASGSANLGGPSFVAQAQEAPKPIRFVEPEYSREARRRRIQAQVIVEVRVNEKGTVDSSRIVDRFIRDKEAKWMPVQELGYGVEEAVLAAAERWRFVPARHYGRVVASLATLEFTIGQ